MIVTLYVIVVCLTGGVLLLGFLLLGLMRRVEVLDWHFEQMQATTPRKIGRDGLALGVRAPDFTLPTLDRQDRSFHDFSSRRILLVFVQQGCGPCHDLLPVLPRFQTDALQVLVVHNGSMEEADAELKSLSVQFPVFFQHKYEVSKLYEILGAPFAFLINESGRVVAKGIVNTAQHLQLLLDEAKHWESSAKSADGKAASHESTSKLEQPGIEAEAVADHA